MTSIKHLLVQALTCSLVWCVHNFPDANTHRNNLNPRLKSCPHIYSLPLAFLHYRWTSIDPLPFPHSSPLLPASIRPSIIEYLSAFLSLTPCSLLSVLSRRIPANLFCLSFPITLLCLSLHLFALNSHLSSSSSPSCHPLPSLFSPPVSSSQERLGRGPAAKFDWQVERIGGVRGGGDCHCMCESIN